MIISIIAEIVGIIVSLLSAIDLSIRIFRIIKKKREKVIKI